MKKVEKKAAPKGKAPMEKATKGAAPKGAFPFQLFGAKKKKK